MDDLKRKKREREEVGVTLYGVQQELARQQSNFESLHDHLTKSADLRRTKENNLQTVREEYKSTQQQVDKERRKSKNAVIDY